MHADHACGVLHEDREDHHGESAAFTQIASVDERNGETGGGIQQARYVCAHAEYEHDEESPSEHGGQNYGDDDCDGRADIGLCGFFSDVGGGAVVG